VNLQEIEYGSETYRCALRLREAVLRRPLGLRLTEADLREEHAQLHFGLICEDRIIACVVAVPLSATEARIRQTAVEPTWQRQGLARTMMRQLEDNLAARGFRSLSLHARASAVGFYSKLGYQPVGEEFIEVTIPHRKMVKSLI
jgi:ribosomal protein S18 acetylase RimI-like enzyme